MLDTIVHVSTALHAELSLLPPEDGYRLNTQRGEGVCSVAYTERLAILGIWTGWAVLRWDIAWSRTERRAELAFQAEVTGVTTV